MNNNRARELFVGQQEAMRILETWRVDTNTQALLFTGPVGIGKKTLALKVAKSLLCQNGDDLEKLAACGSCPQCLLFEAGTHPDFHHLAKGEKERNIPIDRIRKELVADIGMRPQQGPRKVYIIEADGLAETAQNAILKTLEEPYAYAYILLTVSEASKLLPTTLSRLMEIRLTAYEDLEMKRILSLQAIEDLAIVDAVLPVAAGIPGTAILLATSDWFSPLKELVFDTMHALAKESKAELITSYVKRLADMKDQAAMIFDLREAWLRDLLIVIRGMDSQYLVHKNELPHYNGVASRLKNRYMGQDDSGIIQASSQSVYRAIERVVESRRALASQANVDLTLTSLMIVLIKQLR